MFCKILIPAGGHGDQRGEAQAGGGGAARQGEGGEGQAGETLSGVQQEGE